MSMTQTMSVRFQHDHVPLLLSRFKLQTSGIPLPCRGCTDKCPDYQQCNGKPWRLAQGLIEGSQP